RVDWLTPIGSAVIPRHRHEHHTRAAPTPERIVLRLAVVVAAKRCVYDFRAHHTGIIVAPHLIHRVQEPKRIHDLYGHDTNVPTNAGHSESVIRRSADEARDKRAVLVVVVRITVLVSKIVPAVIVHVPVM